MFCAHLNSDTGKNDAVVLRVFGLFNPKGLEFTFDRSFEIQGLQVGHKLGISQPVYAIFTNGVAYKYATGRTLTPGDLENPKIIRYIFMV